MNKILEVYKILFESLGPQGWWPITSMAGTPGFDSRGYHKGKYVHPRNGTHAFEIFVGAILTQNTSWANVEKAMAELRKNGLLAVNKINRASPSKLARCIRSSGYFNQKTERLKQISQYISENYGGDVLMMFNKSVDELRDELLSLKGVGPETADSILLYAAKKPVFVIDAYTKRICSRMGVCEKDVSYGELQDLFHKELPADLRLFNEYHALLVELAKQGCTKRNPLCGECPVSTLCKKLV